jgi:hypothetical protein
MNKQVVYCWRSGPGVEIHGDERCPECGDCTGHGAHACVKPNCPDCAPKTLWAVQEGGMHSLSLHETEEGAIAHVRAEHARRSWRYVGCARLLFWREDGGWRVQYLLPPNKGYYRNRFSLFRDVILIRKVEVKK